MESALKSCSTQIDSSDVHCLLLLLTVGAILIVQYNIVFPGLGGNSMHVVGNFVPSDQNYWSVTKVTLKLVIPEYMGSTLFQGRGVCEHSPSLIPGPSFSILSKAVPGYKTNSPLPSVLCLLDSACECSLKPLAPSLHLKGMVDEVTTLCSCIHVSAWSQIYL